MKKIIFLIVCFLCLPMANTMVQASDMTCDDNDYQCIECTYNISDSSNCKYVVEATGTGAATVNMECSEGKISHKDLSYNNFYSEESDKLICPEGIYSEVYGGGSYGSEYNISFIKFLDCNNDVFCRFFTVKTKKDNELPFKEPGAESHVCEYEQFFIEITQTEFFVNPKVYDSSKNLDYQITVGSNVVHEAFYKNETFSCPKIGTLCGSGTSPSQYCTISLGDFGTVDGVEGTEPETGDDIKEQNSIITGVKFKELLGALKMPLTVKGYTGDFDFITFDLSDITPNSETCSNLSLDDNYCKDNLEFYIESSIENLAEYCDIIYTKYLAYNDYSERAKECNAFYDFYEFLYANGYVRDLSADCGFISKDLNEFIRGFLNIIMIAAPILAVGLGILDFVKVIASGDADKEMKKAFKNFLTRIGLAILLLIIPIILTFLMDLFLTNQPGYDPDSPFCGVVFDD